MTLELDALNDESAVRAWLEELRAGKPVEIVGGTHACLAGDRVIFWKPEPLALLPLVPLLRLPEPLPLEVDVMRYYPLTQVSGRLATWPPRPRKHQRRRPAGTPRGAWFAQRRNRRGVQPAPAPSLWSFMWIDDVG